MVKVLKVLTETSGSLPSLTALMDQAVSEGAKALTLFCADNNGYTSSQLAPLLQSLSIPIFGGVFPELISEDGAMDKGNILILWDSAIQTSLNQNISTLDSDSIELPQSSTSDTNEGFFMLFIDGLAQGIEVFLDDIYLKLGGRSDIVGGGAGSMSFEQAPCIISNDGLQQDCAVLAWIPRKIGIGIKHGWNPIAGPFVATSNQQNEVNALNYQPAFDMYSEAISQSTGASFEGKEFFEVAKTYPLGLLNLDSDLTVRDPIIKNEQSLVCVGNVPNYSKVFILEGKPETLIAAAGEATKKSLESLNEQHFSADFSFVFDCISRAMFLEDEFKDELGEISEALPASHKYCGLLTLGEISTSELSALQLHNKSVVIASLGVSEKHQP